MNRSEKTSQAQQGLYILHCIDPQSPTYNVSCNFQLHGALNRDALESSIKFLVERHESLRTAFRLDAEQLVQVILTEEEVSNVAEYANGYISCRSLDKELSNAQCQDLVNEEINKPFDLHRAPLFRCTLFSDKSGLEHLFVIAVHHTVFDHQSKSILMHELGELYNHYAQQAPLELGPSVLQFSDYIRARDKKLEGANVERPLKFWRKKLDTLESLELPLEKPRPELPSGEGVRLERELPAELVKLIKEYASSQQVTFFIATLAVGKALLALWTGKKDISVGTHIADRAQPGTDRTVGFLLNTLVLRTRYEEDDTFADFLKSVQKTCFNAFRYADTPFETLVNELQPTRDYQKNPFFDVRFSHLQSSENPLQLSGLSVEPIELAHCRARYDLTLTVRESGNRCFIQAEYRSALFNNDTIEWLLDKFIDLSSKLITNPQTRLDQCTLIDSDLRNKLVHQFNDTRSIYPKQKTLMDLIEKQSRQSPAANALHCDGVYMSYQELLRRSGQLAVHLQMKGVGNGALVAISLERSLDMVVAVLAVLRTGAAYLPIDHHYPDARIQHMISDSGCAHIISYSCLEKHLPANDAAVVWLDTERNDIDALPDTPQPADFSPESLAYIIYTSGSTGIPKGVQVTHRNVVNFLCSMRTEPGISSTDKVVAVTTLSFDIAVLEIWLPLICGATSIIATSAQTIDGGRLLKLINDQQATMMQATPITWRLLVNAGWKGGVHFKSLCGGEAMPADLAAELFQRSGEVWNMYGPTETTVWSSVYKISDPAKPILIGKPIANTTMYILDWCGRPSYPGVVGELYIGGDGVTAGYLGREELTREKFVQASFLDDRIIVATGDAARYTADGNIECLGRLDNQIKVRGHRIELGEIESRLNEHEAVLQSVATTVMLDASDTRIIAGVELHTPKTIDNSQWREWLRKSLPEYMMPQVVITMDALPLTPNGKLDRSALAATDFTDRMPMQNPAPPQTLLEKSMAQIWSTLLGLSSVPVNQTFFDLGGHSLLAMQMIARAREDLHISIDPVAMASDSIRELLASHDDEADSIQVTTAPQRQRSMETFFFCNDELYGRLHRPVDADKACGAVLLCSPIFVEASNILWGYQRLAKLLSEQGYYVMRFDYYGCGNSMGKDEQGNATRWQHDVGVAATKLLEMSGQSQLSVVGFRYGATLAANLKTAPVDKLVLWEPVYSSNDHVALLDRRYNNTIKYLNVLHRAKPSAQENEITGFAFDPPMRESLQALELINAPLVRQANSVHLVTNDASMRSNALTGLLESAANSFVTRIVNDSVPGIEEHDDLGTWLPGKSLNTLVECIVGRSYA